MKDKTKQVTLENPDLDLQTAVCISTLLRLNGRMPSDDELSSALGSEYAWRYFHRRMVPAAAAC